MMTVEHLQCKCEQYCLEFKLKKEVIKIKAIKDPQAIQNDDKDCVFVGSIRQSDLTNKFHLKEQINISKFMQCIQTVIRLSSKENKPEEIDWLTIRIDKRRRYGVKTQEGAMNISSIPISIEQKMILKMNLPLQDFNEADKDNTIKPIKIKLKQTLLNNRHNQEGSIRAQMKQLNDRIGQVEMCFREFQKVMELKLKYYNLKINQMSKSQIVAKQKKKRKTIIILDKKQPSTKRTMKKFKQRSSQMTQNKPQTITILGEEHYIPIQFEENCLSYLQFSVSNTMIRKIGGYDYQPMLLKYQLPKFDIHICVVRLLNCQSRCFCIGIIDSSQKLKQNGTQPQNYLSYRASTDHTIKNIAGMNFLIKQRLEKMEQGDDIEMSIDMDRQCVTWRVKNSSATEDIPEELKGTVLVPFVSLYNTDDSLQFVEKR